MSNIQLIVIIAVITVDYLFLMARLSAIEKMLEKWKDSKYGRVFLTVAESARGGNMNCLRCGKEIGSTTGGIQMCGECLSISKSVDFSKQLGIHSGWLCPKCGAVLAPTQPYCTFCTPEHPLWMWGDTK